MKHYSAGNIYRVKMSALTVLRRVKSPLHSDIPGSTLVPHKSNVVRHKYLCPTTATTAPYGGNSIQYDYVHDRLLMRPGICQRSLDLSTPKLMTLLIW